MSKLGIQRQLPLEVWKICRRIRRQILQENGTSSDCCFDASWKSQQIAKDLTMKTIKIVNGEPGLLARLVWQELFNFYRENDGNLNKLDSFLCDLSLLKGHFERKQSANFSLIWVCDPKSGYTDLNRRRLSELPDSGIIATISFWPASREIKLAFTGK